MNHLRNNKSRYFYLKLQSDQTFFIQLINTLSEQTNLVYFFVSTKSYI